MRDTIEAAPCANSAITLEDAVTQMRRIASQPPFFDTPCRAESKPARWDFEAAPAAQTASIQAFRKGLAIGAATRHHALRSHPYTIQLRAGIFGSYIVDSEARSAWECIGIPCAASNITAMGFLDNLESSLKNLETTEERDGSAHVRRTEERARLLAEAPWAERLKSSDFTKRLFDEAAIAGHRIRAKVYMAWFDGTLRLEVRERRLELRPTAEGIVAAFIEPDGQLRTKPIDLAGEPQGLIDEWLG